MAKYRVEFEYIESDGSVGTMPRTIPLTPGSKPIEVGVTRDPKSGEVLKVDYELQGPWIVESQPFEGELSDAELASIRGLHNTSVHWRFTIKEL